MKGKDESLSLFHCAIPIKHHYIVIQQNGLATVMQDNNDKLDSLEHHLKTLSFQQQRINNELKRIREEIDALKQNKLTQSSGTDDENPVKEPITPTLPQPVSELKANTEKEKKTLPRFYPQKKIPSKQLEDIIGTNIINKIGILITIVGVFIGVKYAIDKDLISPAMRVILGYMLAVALLGIGQKLKAKYLDFSSVIMSGGVTIIYFITFIGYDFYNLFPQAIAFLLMVATTVLAVWLALSYNRKIIALLGQVGAYAVPFLLSDGSGKVLVLFSYIAIINIGLLVLSVKKDWKIIYRSAFFVSWVIYLLTITLYRETGEMFGLPFSFLIINFITFYAAFLSYKMVKKELYQFSEIIILLINAFAFFLIGYDFIKDSFHANDLLVIFTVSNAVLHTVAGIWIKKRKLADPTVSMFIIGLGISFITIAIPIAFEGSWITLLWVIEAAILCYIGYRSARALYLYTSLALFVLMMISLIIDWGTHYDTFSLIHINNAKTTAFSNLNFVNSVVVCLCLGVMSRLALTNKAKINGWVNDFFNTYIPLFFIGLLYLTFGLEIALWWKIDLFNHPTIEGNNFKILTEILFSQVYTIVWLLLNRSYIKEEKFAGVMIILTLVTVLILLTGGLNAIGDIRQYYLDTHIGQAVWIFGFRYLCFVLLALQMILLRSTRLINFNTLDAERIYATVLNTVILTVICNEFIHWMDVCGYSNQYKLGLSIICGVYALILVTFGIIKKKKHLRISAIGLLGATLIKLFFYDLVSLSTISKTIVLIILGVILLIASFLYNKFKDTLFGDE